MRAFIISVVSMGRVILLKVVNIVHLDGEGGIGIKMYNFKCIAVLSSAVFL